MSMMLTRTKRTMGMPRRLYVGNWPPGVTTEGELSGRERKPVSAERVSGARGYGFSSAEDGGEVFFHSSALEGIEFGVLEEGDSVEFDVEGGPKGPRAVNVRMTEA